MNTSFKIFARKDFVKKDGTVPVYLRLTIGRKVQKYSLNISVNPHFWDPEKALMNLKHIEAEKTNILLKNYYNKADTIIYDSLKLRETLTHESFKQKFFGNDVSKSFFDFVESELRNDVRLKPQTKRYFKGDLSKLRKFTGNLNFADINLQFLQKYERYMYETLENKVNTVHKSMKFLRNFINRAMMQNYIDASPFLHYQIKTEPTHREFLTMQEIDKLIDKKVDKRLNKVKNYFLFCCFTGLRYSDVSTLRYKNIKNNILEIVTHKTNKRVRIPLTKQALRLIDNPEMHLPDERLFKVATNNVVNRYLKELMTKAEINKSISFHCSRHTFATNALNLGIPLDVVSELLGTDIKVAKVYAKMLDEIKIKEMKKFDRNKKARSNAGL
jgi:integrase